MQTKDQKKQLVKDLTEELKSSKAVVFSDFKGLTVKNMTALRKELREKDVSFQVLKKTLLNLVFKDAKVEMDAQKMEGQIAVAISQKDEAGAARIIAKMAETSGNLKIVGGMLDKNILSKAEVEALSKLPGKEELLAQLVRTFNAPISGLVNVMAGNIRNFVQVLKAIGEAK